MEISERDTRKGGWHQQHVGQRRRNARAAPGKERRLLLLRLQAQTPILSHGYPRELLDPPRWSPMPRRPLSDSRTLLCGPIVGWAGLCSSPRIGHPRQRARGEFGGESGLPGRPIGSGVDRASCPSICRKRTGVALSKRLTWMSIFCFVVKPGCPASPISPDKRSPLPVSMSVLRLTLRLTRIERP